MTLRFVACLLLALTTGFAQAQSWPTQRWSKVIREANVKPE